MTISAVDNDNIQDSQHSAALSEFLNDLYLERVGETTTTDDFESSCSSSSDSEDSVSVTISIDGFGTSHDSSISSNTNDLKGSSHNTLNGSTHHTRRRRFRRSSSVRKPQRPLFAVTQDNARAIRSRSSPLGEMRVSSYHSSTTALKNTSSHSKYPLSASLHSLGSRTGISSTSVTNWRGSQHRRRVAPGRLLSKNNHRDSRWSESGKEMARSSSNNSRVKTTDFGFVNDSLHRKTTLRRKKKGSDIRNTKQDSKTSQARTKATKAIKSAIRVAQDRVMLDESSSDESSSEGEEFFEDDDESFSLFTVRSLATERGSNTTISSRRSNQHDAKALPSSRSVPLRTRSSGDMPRLPTRTRDDSFDETIEPLKDCSEHGEFFKTPVRRSMSDDTTSNSNSNHPVRRIQRRGSDPLGRWAATITTRGVKDPNPPLGDCALRPAVRLPSNSSRRTTGRNSNHSRDSSDGSDTESSFCFDDSFARGLDLEDDSLTATVATTGSSEKGSSMSSSYERDSFKLLLPSRRSSGHTHRRLAIPESLRRLPHHSFHGSTISSKSAMSTKHPGKSLRTSGRNKERHNLM